MGFIKTNLLKSIDWADPSKNVICYKYPMEGRQIMFGSKLTVRESQAAVFMNKGKIADVFGPGMYTLKASNIPILTQLLALPYGFKSPFVADVFFINTKQFTNQKWGTTNPITMRDKEFGTIRVRGYGSYAFQVTDPALFLKELAGTNSTYTSDDISNFLRSHLVSCISDSLAESHISALDLSANYQEFGEVILNNAQQQFADMGLKLTKLIIENLSFPEEVEKAIDARSSMGVMGDNMDEYVRYQSAKALSDAAKNPGAGGVGALGAGLALGEVVRDSINNNQKRAPKNAVYCPECGQANRPNAKFCSNCGKKLGGANTCKKCGATVPAGAKFCPECGQKI